MRKALSGILIVVTLALFYNNVANWHFHELPNGIVIEHAHPYEKAPVNQNSPAQNHKHSDLEYLILDLVFHTSLIILLFLAGVILFRLSERLYRIDRSNSLIPCRQHSTALLRAPPSF